MFEGPGNIAADAERERNISKVERVIETASARYRAEGVPLGKDGRILMQAYRKIHPDVDDDLKNIQGRNRRWKKEIEEVSAESPEGKTTGEALELLAYAIFIKNLGTDFIVARSSLRDDHENGVDTILLDRKTGKLVCAFDDVGETGGPVYIEKSKIVQKRNLDGGASLKYGLKLVLEPKEGKTFIAPAENNNLPLFFIALPKSLIEEGLSEFVSDEKAQSDFEKNLFLYFMSSIENQIKGLELHGKRIDPALRDKLTPFKKIAESFNSQRETVKGK